MLTVLCPNSVYLMNSPSYRQALAVQETGRICQLIFNLNCLSWLWKSCCSKYRSDPAHVFWILSCISRKSLLPIEAKLSCLEPRITRQLLWTPRVLLISLHSHVLCSVSRQDEPEIMLFWKLIFSKEGIKTPWVVSSLVHALNSQLYAISAESEHNFPVTC